MLQRIYYIVGATILLAISSCKKMLEIPEPATQIVSDKVFTTPELATQATFGMYVALNPFETNFTPYAALYIGDATSISTSTLYTHYLNNTVRPDDGNNLNAWRSLYNAIYQSNAIIEGLTTATIADTLKRRLTGESLFIRAYSYCYLASIWGDAPLLTTTDINQTATAGRESKQAIYKQVVEDLINAEQLLGDYPSEEKVRAGRGAVNALQARVYLMLEDWDNAALSASKVINSARYRLTALPDVFIKNSGEAILQLWSQNGYSLSRSMVPSAATAIPGFIVNVPLAQGFEAGDSRKSSWTLIRTSAGNTYTLQSKYKAYAINASDRAEYTMLLRLAEQYLIRAEANLERGNLTEAAVDINVIRARAGLPKITDGTQAQLIQALRKERNSELFFENGLRFFDLKRWKIIDAEVSQRKSNWRSFMALLPIPQTERDKNPLLGQNNGY